MKTKRDIVDKILQAGRFDDVLSNAWIERYDAAPDERPLTTELTSEPTRPTVHEIAMHLLAAQGQGMPRSETEARCMACDAYRVAEAVYNTGTDWDKEQHSLKFPANPDTGTTSPDTPLHVRDNTHRRSQ